MTNFLSFDAGRLLLRRLKTDRLHPRAAALAFHTVLAIVPMAAVTFALIDLVGGGSAPRTALEFFSERYLPPSTARGVEALYPLVDGTDFESIGLVGLAFLLPIMLALVFQVELALTDIFRSKRGRRAIRVPVYSVLVLTAPMGALVTVHYVPEIHGFHLWNRHLLPFLTTWAVLFLAFRFLPKSVKFASGPAAVGSALAAALLAATKLAFGFYAARAATTLHVVWGTVTFLPLVLTWVFLTWYVILLGAEVTAVGGKLQRTRDR
ncbi:MAG: YihY family inner membrane protein [Myxococcales bacterium]|nr:YihY family inner membrane protein [Myxococcales bacterium]